MRRLVIGEPTGVLRVEETPDHHPWEVRPAPLKDKVHAFDLLPRAVVRGDRRRRADHPVGIGASGPPVVRDGDRENTLI